MKIIFIIVLLAVAVYADISESDAIAYYNEVNEAVHQVDEAPLDWFANLNVPTNLTDLIQLYCGKAGNGAFYEVPLNDPALLEKIDFTEQSHFFFHGWISNTTEDWATDFKNNWVASGRDGNLCLVDWSLLAYADYVTTAFINQRLVAIYMADTYLPWLQTQGLVYSDIILLGHSMGAQIIGYIGQLLYNEIQFMIGMDPAGPLFQSAPHVFRLSDDDATYVQSTHTCSGLYGYAERCGDADFYLNLGVSPQPQCTVLTADDPVAIHCSHARALSIFIDSLLYPISDLCEGVRCFSTALYLSHECLPYTTDYFGLDTLKLQGEFYTSTGTSTTCTGDLWLQN